MGTWENDQAIALNRDFGWVVVPGKYTWTARRGHGAGVEEVTEPSGLLLRCRLETIRAAEIDPCPDPVAASHAANAAFEELLAPYATA